MLTKSLILAAAASGLMAGAALAQDLDKTTPAEIQDDAHSSLTVNPAPDSTVLPARPADSAATGTLSDTSTLAPGSLTIETVTNGPVPDTRANRAKYGMPESNAGKMTAPRGN